MTTVGEVVARATQLLDVDGLTLRGLCAVTRQQHQAAEELGLRA